MGIKVYGSKIGTAISVILLFIAGSLIFIYLIQRQKAHKKRVLFYCAVWLICPLFLIAGYFRTDETEVSSNLKSFLESKIDGEITGTINDISIREDGYILTLTDPLTNIGSQNFHSKKLNITINEDTTIDFIPEPGMRIRTSGKIYPFEKATNPGQFDSELYYRIRNVDAKMYASSASLIETYKNGYRIKRLLYHLRCRLTEGIFTILPPKEAGVLTAMLTGERGLLDSEIKDLYSDGGIAHILSISALHITLLGMGLFRFLMFLTKRLRLCSTITFLIMIAYGVLTGFSVSTQRAVIMIAVTLLAKNLGKAYDRLSACGAAALIILLIQPLFIYDSGFLLSFTAVVSINVSQWIAEKYKIENIILKAILPCISIWIFTLPVVMCTYYKISVFSILINPIVIIFMSMLLVSGAIAGLFSVLFAGGTLAALFAGPVYFILKLYEFLCEAEKIIPYSKIITGTCTKTAIIVFYSVLIAVMIIFIRYGKKYILLGLILCGCVFIKSEKYENSFTFLDVGQGDCSIIRTGNTTVLVDGGSSSNSKVGKYIMIPFFMYNGIQKLDAVFVSHTDKDHISGIMELMEEGYPKIEKIFVGYNVEDDEEMIIKATENGIPVIKLKAHDVPDISEKAGKYKVLAPEKDHIYSDKNAASVVLLFEIDGIGLLLTGDSDFSSEDMYSKYIDEDSVNILKVPHHGSKYSTSELLLERIKTEIAVISCAKYNSYGHPADETLKRLNDRQNKVYVTSDTGAVTITYDDEISVECFEE